MNKLIVEEVVFENEDLRSHFNKKGIDTRIIDAALKIISTKVNNNKIGYFQFRYNEKYIKLYIIPKVFEHSQNPLYDFFNYIKKYYLILNKYDTCKFKGFSKHPVDDNYIDIGIENGLSNLNSFDDLLLLKYISTLKRIEGFFQRFNFKNYEYKNYSSNNVKYPLNMRKNFVELNKAKIHQHKKVNNNYSEIAQITMLALDYINKYKGSIFLFDNEMLNTTLRIKGLISKKFIITNNTFKIQRFFSPSIKKLFFSHDERNLYNDIAILLGDEIHDVGQGDKNLLFKAGGFKFIAFEPEIIYEFIVFDELLKIYSDPDKVYFNKHNDDRNINKKDSEQELFYVEDFRHIKGNNEPIESVVKVNPDFIIKTQHKVIVADAKWIIINSRSDINKLEIEKLKRDCLHWNTDEGILIHPLIKYEHLIRNPKNSIHFKDARFDNEIFILRFKEIRVN